MHRYKIILLLAISLLLSGCLGPISTQEVKIYTLKALRNLTIPTASRSQKTLLVTTPIANPGFYSNKMAYEQIPYRLRYFSQHRWVASPAQMILPVLADYVRSAGYFKAVLVAPFSGNSDYRLDTHLIALQQEFIQPISKVRLVLQVTVINNVSNQVIAWHRFEQLIPTQSNDPYSGVLAANAALSKVAQQISQFVIRSVS
jgi:cholesterol transport system auxiliary component